MYSQGLKNKCLCTVRQQLWHHTLASIGIKPAPIAFFAGASHPRRGQMSKWLTKVQSLCTIANYDNTSSQTGRFT